MSQRVAVIIVAGGKGLRMGLNIPKQYIKINNKPILLYTIDKFYKNKYIDEIVLVVSKDYINFCKHEILENYKYNNINIIEGGKERQDSVYNGLRSLKNVDIVLVHDAVRPFVSDNEISNLICETNKNKSCVLGVKVKDTIKISKNNIIEETLDRNKLWAIQTPQSFKYETLMKAYENAIKNNIKATDDATLLEILQEEIYIIEGNYNNIKITTIEDLEYAKYLLFKED